VHRAFCGDPGRRLRGQRPPELREEELLIGLRFRVARKDQLSAIGRREVDIEQLERSELVQDLPHGEPGRVGPEVRPERDVQAVGEEGDEDMGLDPGWQLVVDRPHGEVPLQMFEGRLDLNQL